MKLDPDYQAALDREVGLWPGVSYSLEHAAKHVAVVLAFQGRTRRYFVPATPSDRCGGLNAASGIRRVLAELGAERVQRARRRRQPMRRRSHPSAFLDLERFAW